MAWQYVLFGCSPLLQQHKARKSFFPQSSFKSAPRGAEPLRTIDKLPLASVTGRIFCSITKSRMCLPWFVYEIHLHHIIANNLSRDPLARIRAQTPTARNRTVGAAFRCLAGAAYRDRCFLNAVKCNFDHQLVCPAFVDCMLFEHIDITVAACGPGFQSEDAPL